MREYFQRTKNEAEKTKVESKKESDPYYDAIKKFQSDRFEVMIGKVKFFKVVSVLCMVIIAIQAGALALMSPLKTAVPVMLRVDSNTGYTDVVSPLSNSQETYSEVENKFFLSQYVVNYESYDWQTIQAMNDAVNLMSDSKTFSQYRTQITADNSPLNVLKQNNKIKVRVKSVTFLKPDIAQVRFDKAVLNTDGTLAVDFSQTSWVATIAFDYQKAIKTEGERLINPLGFQTLSYRVDPEAIK
ncbi:virB8 family protein [Buttiauxella sp. B2]|uniref:virB8 family protein n=1 Tax=Buttiauxella sp. B2 TaxID=2587812 RepID=UPI0016760CFD|nr:type IV secretion system protein [Buttiauxella sp. B2]